VINAFCYGFGEDGWARHARHFFGAWRKHEPVIISSWNEPPSGLSLPADFNAPSPSLPGVGLGPIEFMPTVSGTRRIAYVLWETTIIPPDKVQILKAMDEIWVPSSWGRRLFIDNGIPEDMVHIVPEGVDVQKFRPQAPPRAESRPFRFLFIGQWAIRKGVDLLIKAYRQEFRRNEPVELVLHAFNPYIGGFNLEATLKRAVRWRRTPPIVLSQPLSEDGLVRLYNDCDAFVLPTRAEGWGLPITEAMACGLPVIVTGYSAPLDYLNDDIAYLIPVKRLVAVRDRQFFPAGRALGKWAEPDLASLRKHMRHVYENRDEAREKGRRARAEVCARWTWDHAATTARELLWGNPKNSTAPSDTQAISA
jgi:glycosyltransferase involved in cell wall biosynthesis